jgi:hypothetical protein
MNPPHKRKVHDELLSNLLANYKNPENSIGENAVDPDEQSARRCRTGDPPSISA